MAEHLRAVTLRWPALRQIQNLNSARRGKDGL